MKQHISGVINEQQLSGKCPFDSLLGMECILELFTLNFGDVTKEFLTCTFWPYMLSWLDTLAFEGNTSLTTLDRMVKIKELKDQADQFSFN
jgi:hypothetical protein